MSQSKLRWRDIFGFWCGVAYGYLLEPLQTDDHMSAKEKSIRIIFMGVLTLAAMKFIQRGSRGNQ